jgi:tRNA (guanine6-N2)-methyltransferase
MTAKRTSTSLPSCYAQVIPGLEEIAAEEIQATLGAQVSRLGPGWIVFRPPSIDRRLLCLRITEDVFLLAWGTEELTYRARDLESIRRWTARAVDWEQLLRLHHALRPRPEGRPTIRLVAQMRGQHGYRRVDARQALAEGLAGKLPARWRHVEEHADVEIWLTIHEAQAVCGLRLSDRRMRHRTYKRAHLPASLRPTVAAALVRLVAAQAGDLVLDPMCGAGTILAEQAAVRPRPPALRLLGGDWDRQALHASRANFLALGEDIPLICWDARRLPLPAGCVACLASNPPFGVQLGQPETLAALYRQMTQEYQRVLQPGGRIALLAADAGALRQAVRPLPWRLLRQVRLRLLGQRATLFLWRKEA